MRRRRKPDFMLVLVVILGCGVLVTGYLQDRLANASADTVSAQG